MAEIIWVEDQTHWIEKFRTALETAELDAGLPNQVQIFRFAEAALTHIRQREQSPDIVILDANLNGNDSAGLSLSSQIKKRWPEVPLLFLSEYAGTDTERRAFEQTETEDFIAKHQNNVMEVLCWRIKALLRKSTLKSQPERSELLTSGPLTIDLTDWQVYWHQHPLTNPKNHRRALAPMPRKILRALVEASPRPLSTEQLAAQLDSESLSRESYRQHIKTLREAFDAVCEQYGLPLFSQLQSKNQGIVTMSEQQAYCWRMTEGKR